MPAGTWLNCLPLAYIIAQLVANEGNKHLSQLSTQKIHIGHLQQREDNKQIMYSSGRLRGLICLSGMRGGHKSGPA